MSVTEFFLGGTLNIGVRSSMFATDCSVPKLSFYCATVSKFMDFL